MSNPFHEYCPKCDAHHAAGDCTAWLRKQYHDLRTRLADAQARAERAEGALEDKLQTANLLLGMSKDGDWDEWKRLADRLLERPDALTPAPQGRTDGERLCGQLPNSYGVWWWQSDGESAPAVVHIAQDSSGKFFATIGQYGWTEPQFVEDMGGLWVKCREPQMVPFHEFEEAMDATAPEVKGGGE